MGNKLSLFASQRMKQVQPQAGFSGSFTGEDRDSRLEIPGLACRAMEPFRFLDLPAELRNAIYAEVVIVGIVIYSPSITARRNHTKPDLTLLRVCKQIHDEAESLYLSKNTFQFPNNWIKCLPFAETTDSGDAFLQTLPRHMFSQAAFKFVRNISLTFTSDQLSPVDYQAKWEQYEKKYGEGSYHALGWNQLLGEAYDWVHEESFLEWDNMVDTLDRFEHGLDFVHADFKHAFCSTGCCHAVQRLTEYLLQEIEPERIGISGLLAGEEEDLVSYFGGRYGEWRSLTLGGTKTMYNMRFDKSDQ